MTKKILEEIQKAIDNRQKAALCIVTNSKGSTPRKISSKMLVFNDGRIVGSIGGGELEHQVIKKIPELLKNNKPEILDFTLKKDLQMACGGTMQVYIEPIKLPDQLIIFGAGHISKALARLAENLDFQTIIIDERKGIFDDWQKLKNYTFINKIYSEAIKNLSFDSQTYICSATYAHTHDKEIAALCANKPKAYLGVIASKNKARIISEYLKNEKNIEANIVEKIEMPCGIDIKCETPEEIAISIIARIIDIRNTKNEQ